MEQTEDKLDVGDLDGKKASYIVQADEKSRQATQTIGHLWMTDRPKHSVSIMISRSLWVIKADWLDIVTWENIEKADEKLGVRVPLQTYSDIEKEHNMK